MDNVPRVDKEPDIQDRVVVSDIVGYPPRTHVLSVLRRRGTPMTLDDLSCHVVDGMSDDPTGPSASTVRKTSVGLHHTHLPLLDETGVIGYNPHERVVTSLNEERLDALLSKGRQILESLQRDRPREE